MSNKREPLLSDERMGDIRSRHDHALSVKASAYVVRDHYEAARQKDAELIQQLVDRVAIVAKADRIRCGPGPCPQCEANTATLATAQAAGFKPTQP